MMEGFDGRTDRGSLPPATWGSTIDVASGTSSSTSPPFTAPGAPRPLDMQASLPLSGDERSDVRAMDGSSPVEQFSSPSKAEGSVEHLVAFHEGIDNVEGVSQSYVESLPAIVGHVGSWQVPDVQERSALQVDIDPNGDDEEVGRQVEHYRKKRRRGEADVPPSSIPSQLSTTEPYQTPSQLPTLSTPPPATKRPRRGKADAGPSPDPPANLGNPGSTEERYSNNTSDLLSAFDVQALMNDSVSDASCQAINQCVRASVMIPDFLKDEIQAFVYKAAFGSQSVSDRSESDTQEDGFLQTKPFWFFELARKSGDDIIAGSQLSLEVTENTMTLVLHITRSRQGNATYAISLMGQTELMKKRNEVPSNPWFDGNGHPFSIVYKMHTRCDRSSNDVSFPSVVTQSSGEQLSLLQNEVEQLSEEKRLATEAQAEMDRKLQQAQSDYEFLRDTYQEASSKAVELAKTNNELHDEVDSLKRQLANGLESVRTFSQQRIETLQTKLKVTQGQLDMLIHQNRLTDDAIRQKAGMWDAYQAKEQARLRELEKRRAEVDEERAALYQAMQEEDARRALNLRKAPHERFLEVDLANQREELPSGSREDNDEDELAMLRAEAEEATGGAVDLTSSRARRRRSARASVASDAAQVIAEAQEQASAELAEVLQGEFEYQQASTATTDP